MTNGGKHVIVRLVMHFVASPKWAMEVFVREFLVYHVEIFAVVRQVELASLTLQLAVILLCFDCLP